ncbi:MAG: HAMP domain-containing protein [Balneola sp.]|nr:HAMP domain-containing protein [Balneola sp.]MBO6651854.1 HAMP domain-containing protein [Balneola sp.]MBO6710427.1 HAMP domain-containing protein [Balneola sp.]MBO6799112.1 HAMP domain-containing protein [Balneola sp.]MBO6870952.1 HAMP domain-containing protein [Balneola sp.]
MSLRISTKLIILLIGLTLIVLVTVLTAVNNTFSKTLNEDIVLDFSQLQGFFKQQQTLQYDRLVESSYLISENSTYKANVELNDPASVNFTVNEFALFIKTDLFVVTNNEGKVLAWLNNEERAGTDISSRKSVQDALNGIEPPINIEWPRLWAVNGELFQIVTIPIYAGNNIIGTTTLGTKFQDSEARLLKQNTPLDVIMFLEETPIAYSNVNENMSVYSQFVNSRKGLIDSLTSNLKISIPFRANLNDKEVLAFISPLGTEERAYYIAYVPVDVQFEILSTIQKNILLIAASSFLVIVPIAFIIAGAFSGPLQRLTTAMLKVREGDLNVEVQSKSKDEVGILTKTFNEMLQGLRERFALTKYVGDHTLKMIQEKQTVDLDEKASFQELAILFTDIRGSTSKISTSTPEEFLEKLNKTLGKQADTVLLHNGSIDKYVGDSLIALFAGSDSLKEAINAAIEIQKDFKSDNELNEFFDGIGIGINFGKVILGNMGAKERMDYTVIGSEVNLCARLCSSAKDAQILIPKELISQYSHEVEDLSFREVGAQELKGFKRSVIVSEVLYDIEHN